MPRQNAEVEDAELGANTVAPIVTLAQSTRCALGTFLRNWTGCHCYGYGPRMVPVEHGATIQVISMKAGQ